MIEHTVSVTIFLILVFLLRAIFYNRISRRMCYAMWLVVGIYLLMPFGAFSNSFQILNVVHRDAAAGRRNEVETKDQEYLQSILETEQSDMSNSSQIAHKNDASPDTVPAWSASGTEQVNENQIDRNGAKNFLERKLWIKILWILGCVACAIVFVSSNFYFFKRLRKSRELLETDRKCKKMLGNGFISVYQTEEIRTPCLFGVIRPAVYLPKDPIEPKLRDCVLAHEYTHYRHGDPIWAVLRCLCVCLYWYHPLVWLAALLSGRDSEFACDESVIRTFDTEKRKVYGETLILFGTGGQGRMRLFTGATGMNGSNRELKQRITWISTQKKQHVGTAVMVCILLLGVTGCTIGSPVAGNEGSEVDKISERNERELLQAESVQREERGDLVPEPINFADFLDKTEESGIEYYKVVTEKDMPLPLNEWAKINIFTDQGNAVDAYVRFTQVIKDGTQVEEHINHYIEVREIREPFGMSSSDAGQYVLLRYEIMIAGDVDLDETDRIPLMALDYPLRLYSTLENGKFTYQGIERTVCDISIIEQGEIEPGDTVQKEVVCYIPKGYTAYGLELAYMTAQRTTNMVYFKPEYE